MDELAQWLGEQLDEDERTTRATDQTLGQRNLRWSAKPVDEAFFRVVAAKHYVVGTGEFSPEDAHHIAEWDPARVLREIDGKRWFVEMLANSLKPNPTTGIPRGVAWSMLTRMAEVYRDRPGWKAYWPGSG